MIGESRDGRRASSLSSAGLRYPLGDLTRPLADLACGFGSFAEYPSDHFLEEMDTGSFNAAHPDHPFASQFRDQRQKASGFFWMLAEGDPTRIQDAELPQLHRSLFDCSAAVRYDIAMCLGHLSRTQSAAHLRRLLETEPSSDGVRKVVEWALGGAPSRRHGLPLVQEPAGANVGESGGSDLTEDRMHTPDLGPEQVYNCLWAALSWEIEQGLASDLARENFEYLSRPDFTFGSGASDTGHALHTGRVRAYRRHFRDALSDRRRLPILAKDAHERISSTLFLFRSFGYSEHYAGHESTIRIRLLDQLKQAGGQEPNSELELEDAAHLLAAYYLTFTDYYLEGVPRSVMQAPTADVRAFLSHSSFDKPVARDLADRLQFEGIKVWLDERELRVGDSLWTEIGAGIDTADWMLLLISPRSVASPWVQRELNAGLATELSTARKIVLPVLLEGTEVPVFLRERLYCNLSLGIDEGAAALLRAMLDDRRRFQT